MDLLAEKFTSFLVVRIGERLLKILAAQENCSKRGRKTIITVSVLVLRMIFD
jgi:hypothetical protein